MNILYRKYQVKYIEALLTLMYQLGYTHSTESLSRNVFAVRENAGEIFVAEFNGNVIGCASAIIDVRLAAGTNGEIVSVVVDNHHRGAGVGKGLIASAEQWLRPFVKHSVVRANAIRTESHEFYKGLWYSLSETQTVFTKNL